MGYWPTCNQIATVPPIDGGLSLVRLAVNDLPMAVVAWKNNAGEIGYSRIFDSNGWVHNSLVDGGVSYSNPEIITTGNDFILSFSTETAIELYRLPADGGPPYQLVTIPQQGVLRHRVVAFDSGVFAIWQQGDAGIGATRCYVH